MTPAARCKQCRFWVCDGTSWTSEVGPVASQGTCPNCKRDCTACGGTGVENSGHPDEDDFLGLLQENAHLRARVERLRRALEAAKRPHFVEKDNTDPDSFECRANPPTLYDFPCNCGADEHNAAIDAALRGEA